LQVAEVQRPSRHQERDHRKPRSGQILFFASKSSFLIARCNTYRSSWDTSYQLRSV
ncbi:unnamed protein product, partial [Haemonchus placei]|uniref:Uncharacterized protein n=1 Tax=Haemonchus placei TaxID=6290 RepID=A0A0N4VWU7_HAEPC